MGLEPKPSEQQPRPITTSTTTAPNPTTYPTKGHREPRGCSKGIRAQGRGHPGYMPTHQRAQSQTHYRKSMSLDWGIKLENQEEIPEEPAHSTRARQRWELNSRRHHLLVELFSGFKINRFNHARPLLMVEIKYMHIEKNSIKFHHVKFFPRPPCLTCCIY